MSAYNPFTRQFPRSSLLPPEWKAMFQCFFDDSGDQHSSVGRYVVVAGYMAHNSLYDSVNGWWRDRLLHHGLDNLHMRDLFNVQKERGWSDAKREQVVRDFIQVLREAKLTGIGCAIDSKAWKALPPHQAKTYGNVYDFGMLRVLRLITERMIRCKFTDQVSCTFDQDTNNAVPRLRRFIELRGSHPWIKRHFSSVTFADASQVYGLQMADVLAWEVRRQLIRAVEGQQPSDRYRLLMTPLPGELPEYEWEGWSASTLATQFDDMQKKMASEPESLWAWLPTSL